MKKLLIAAVASTALVSMPAFAQSDTSSDTFDIIANVQDECSVDDPSTFNFGSVDIVETSGADALLIDGDQEATTQNIYVSCNYTASLTLASDNDGLLNADGADEVANDPADFTNQIEYRLRLISTDSSFPDLRLWTVSETEDTVNAGGAFHNNAELRLRIETDDNPLRPVAGNYTDTATVTLGPI